MKVKKYFARKASSGKEKIGHTILEEEDGSMRLLCSPTGKYSKGSLEFHSPEFFLRLCDRCEEAMGRRMARRLSGENISVG